MTSLMDTTACNKGVLNFNSAPCKHIMHLLDMQVAHECCEKHKHQPFGQSVLLAAESEMQDGAATAEERISERAKKDAAQQALQACQRCETQLHCALLCMRSAAAKKLPSALLELWQSLAPSSNEKAQPPAARLKHAIERLRDDSDLRAADEHMFDTMCPKAWKVCRTVGQRQRALRSMVDALRRHYCIMAIGPAVAQWQPIDWCIADDVMLSAAKAAAKAAANAAELHGQRHSP